MHEQTLGVLDEVRDNGSKHAVVSFTKVAGLEYVADGIRGERVRAGAVGTRRAAEAFGMAYEQIAG
jgi:hypothetical protein